MKVILGVFRANRRRALPDVARGQVRSPSMVRYRRAFVVVVGAGLLAPLLVSCESYERQAPGWTGTITYSTYIDGGPYGSTYAVEATLQFDGVGATQRDGNFYQPIASWSLTGSSVPNDPESEACTESWNGSGGRVGADRNLVPGAAGLNIKYSGQYGARYQDPSVFLPVQYHIQCPEYSEVRTVDAPLTITKTDGVLRPDHPCRSMQGEVQPFKTGEFAKITFNLSRPNCDMDLYQTSSFSQIRSNANLVSIDGVDSSNVDQYIGYRPNLMSELCVQTHWLITYKRDADWNAVFAVRRPDGTMELIYSPFPGHAINGAYWEGTLSFDPESLLTTEHVTAEKCAPPGTGLTPYDPFVVNNGFQMSIEAPGALGPVAHYAVTRVKAVGNVNQVVASHISPTQSLEDEGGIDYDSGRLRYFLTPAVGAG